MASIRVRRGRRLSKLKIRFGMARGSFCERDPPSLAEQVRGDREPTMGEWTVRQDLREALRTLRRQPGFAAATIIMLALGIGATTAIFTVVKGVLIDPLPYPNSEALVRIVHNIGGIDQSYFNDAIITTYVENAQAFESLFKVSAGDQVDVELPQCGGHPAAPLPCRAAVGPDATY